MTRRNTPTRTVSAPAMLDLGHGVVAKGTLVRVHKESTGETFSGTLCSVERRDGVPFTAGVWDGGAMRHAYVDEVHPIGGA